MIELIHHLNSIHPLSAEAVAAFIKVMRAKELRRGQVWLQEGAVCDKLTFVVKGLLKLYFETETKELVLQFARENEFILSAQSYFVNTPSDYSIRAVDPSVVVSISKTDLQFLLSRLPELSHHLLVVGQHQINSLEHHSGLIMLPPRERFEKLVLAKSWLVDGKRITDKLLAGYLGVRANAVCEWRKEFKF